MAVPLMLASSPVPAKDSALRLYQNLTGVIPDAQKLAEYQAMLASQGAKATARQIIADSEEFYSVTLRNLFTTWVNRDRSKLFPLTDTSATLIGMVRDGEPFNKAFFEDIVYYVDGEITGQNRDQIRVGSVEIQMMFKGNNQHYEDIERFGLSLADPNILKKHSQRPVLHGAPTAVAGIYSTRGWGEAYYQAGTNRRSVMASMKNFMCREMETLNDTTRPSHRVRRDVDRAPGGNARTFKSHCVGCHAGMDALAGAFAYYDFQGQTNQVTHTHGAPVTKMNHNAIFYPGFFTQSDSFENLWVKGSNKVLGWSNRVKGNGAADFGRMITESPGFGYCMAAQVLDTMCFSKVAHENVLDVTTGKLPEVQRAAQAFQSSYDFKQLFIDIAPLCI